MKYTITAPSNGILRIDNGKYAPGDTLVLKGNFLWLGFYNIQATKEKPILVTNEGTVKIGNTTWNGGGYAQGLVISNCKYLYVLGSSKTEFILDGSIAAGKGAYFNMQITDFSEFIGINKISIRNGGNGIVCKTDPTTDPKSWIENPPLGPYVFGDIDITGTINEAMYIGNTATYYDLTAKQQVYIDPSQFDPTHKYVEPRMLKDVLIYNVNVKDVGVDGIQTAAIEGLIIHHCTVTNWAMTKNWGHNGGILIGGKVRKSKVYCNRVTDGWGEMLQFYGDGSDHEIFNNYFYNNKGDGASFRITGNGTVSFHDNTVWKAGDNTVRVYTGTVKLERNLLVNPRMLSGNVIPRSYIYLEVTGSAIDIDNQKFAKLDVLAPNIGYQEKNCVEVVEPEPEPCPECPDCPECPPIPVPAKPVAILMSDGTRYEIK